MATRMSTVFVLVSVVAFGCSDSADGPDPGDTQRADDPGAEDPADPDPTSDQTQGDGSDNDEDDVDADDEGGGEQPTGAGGHPLGPAEFRARWNELVGATDDGSLQAEYLGMGELRPDGDTVDAEIGGSGAATITATLSADGTLASITVRLLDNPNATQTRRTVTQAVLPRLLLASTLPSQPGLNDPAVTEPAEALSLDETHATETVVAEGVTYSATSDGDGWTFVAQLAP